MISALLSKISMPLLILAFGIVAGIGIQQKVFSPRKVDNTKQFSDEVRKIVAEEIAKLPKPKEAQSLEIDKIKGKVGRLEIHQHYDIQVDGDSLAIDRFASIVEDKLKTLKLSRCK